MSLNDETGPMTSKKSDHDENDDDNDHDHDHDDDDNQTEKDLYKTSSNINHTTKMNNTGLEQVMKTTSTSNVFSRLMHSEQHVQNTFKKTAHT